MTRHRGKVVNRRRFHLSNAIEALENRVLLTALGPGDEFEFLQGPNQQVRIYVDKAFTEFTGAIVDDMNNIILTDLPGRYFSSGTGRSGVETLGGIGGRKGVTNIGTTPITDPAYMPGTLVQIPSNDITFNALAAGPAGNTYGVNFATVLVPGETARKVVQVTEFAGAGPRSIATDPTAEAMVLSMISEASLKEDVLPNSLDTVLNGGVGDVAVDPISGILYVLTTKGMLYTVDRDTGVVQVVTQDPNNPMAMTNITTGVSLTDTFTQAMAFDRNGELWALVWDYDNYANRTDPNSDASGIPSSSNAPQPNNTGVPDNMSEHDVALIHVNKLNNTFTSADVHSVIIGQFESTQLYTAMVFLGDTLLATAQIPQQAAAGGAPAPNRNGWELQSIAVPVGNPNFIGTVTANVVGEIKAPIPPGAKADSKSHIDGLALAMDIDDKPIIVGLDNGVTMANNQPGPRLINIPQNNPGSSTNLSRPASIVSAMGLASYVEPGDARPTLYTVYGVGAGSNLSVIAGSAVSLAVDPATGESTVKAVRAAALNPADNQLYFVADEVDAPNVRQGSILHSMDASAGLVDPATNSGRNGRTGPSRSAIQNSLHRSIRGNFAGNEITAMSFDQTSAYTAQLDAWSDSGDGWLIQGVDLNNTDAGFPEAMQAVEYECDAATRIPNKVTGMAVIGDDPANTPGENRDALEEFLWLSTADGANSKLIRVRRANVYRTDSPPSALDWGLLTGAESGQNLGDIAWNPFLYNPFTFQRGALLGTDTATDELVFVDQRLRPAAVNIFQVQVAQSNIESYIAIGNVLYDPDGLLTVIRPMLPYEGTTGPIRVLDATAPGFYMANPDPGTGLVYLGIKTINAICGVDDDLRPIAPEAELSGSTYTPGAIMNRPLGMTQTTHDGVPNWLPTGLEVGSGGVVEDISDPSDFVIGSNLDIIRAAAVASNGMIAVIDTDRVNARGRQVLDEGDQIGIIGALGGGATSVLDIHENVVVNGVPTTRNINGIQAMDFGDPDGDGIEQLYAIFLDRDTGDLRLGNINTTTGLFTPIGVVPLLSVRAMSFNSSQQLYVVGRAGTFGGDNVYRLDADDASIADYGPSIDNTVTVGSMDFGPGDVLYAHDIASGRLIDINVLSGAIGEHVATPVASLRDSIGAIAYDPITGELIGLDNALSREQLPSAEEATNRWESAMLVTLQGLIGDYVLPQDLGAFDLGGTFTGQVNVSGSMQTFYAGNILTGSAGGQGMSEPQVPYNFRVGGEIRNVLALGSIGTLDASEYDESRYSTNFALHANGSVGQVVARVDFEGSVDAGNDGSTFHVTDDQREYTLQYELEDLSAETALNPYYFQFGAVWRDDLKMYVSLWPGLPSKMVENTTVNHPQYLGTINGPAGTDVIEVRGFGGPDRYSVAMLAGQAVTVQLKPLSIPGGHVEVYDPDGRMIASDYSDVDPEQYINRRFFFVADRPGMYQFVASGNEYELIIAASEDGTTAPGVGDLGIGAIAADRVVFDGRSDGSPWHVQQGDFGGMIAGRRVASVAAPGVLDEDRYDPDSPTYDPTLTREDALVGASFWVNDGNLRAIDSQSIGIFDPILGFGLGPQFDVVNGSVGLLRGTGTTESDVVLANRDFNVYGPPRVEQHYLRNIPPGVARGAAIGGDYQLIDAANRFNGDLMADRGIGVVRAKDLTAAVGPSSSPTTWFNPGFYVVNADQVNDDGVIDLIHTSGDLGNFRSGGPAILTGPGGNVRYMYVGGTYAWRDQFFGQGAPEQTLFQPGEQAKFNDDSGASLTITHYVPDPYATTLPELRITTYQVRDHGGVVVVNVKAETSVNIRAVSGTELAPAEIGHIEVNLQDSGGGTGGAGSDPYIQVDGNTPVDIYDITGEDFDWIANSTHGEIANTDVGNVNRMEGGYVGIARHNTGEIIGGTEIRTDAYPFRQQRQSIKAASIGLIKAKHAVGNIDVAGDIEQIIADCDGVQTAGDYDGITAPVYAQGNITSVDIGRGITSSGNGDPAHSGLFADGEITKVRGVDADIYGNIISETSIGEIQLVNSGSIINADVVALVDLASSREYIPVKVVPSDEDPFTNPTTYEVGDINLMGGLPQRKRVGNQIKTVPAITGGIIGSFFAGGDMGAVTVTRGFGIINSYGYVVGDGRFKNFKADGYGIRDVDIIAGAAMGSMIANGNGALIDPKIYTASVRQSETHEFQQRQGQYDYASHFEPNRLTDINVYLGQDGLMPNVQPWVIPPNVLENEPSTNADPLKKNILQSGVIAGSTFKASRDMFAGTAWGIRGSFRMSYVDPVYMTVDDVYRVTDFDVANSIGALTVANDAEDMEVTTGGMRQIKIGRDLFYPAISIAGVLDSLWIGRDYTGDTRWTPPRAHRVIEAIGPNGEISDIYVGRNVQGLIFAQRRIGHVYVKGKYQAGGTIVQKNVVVAP